MAGREVVGCAAYTEVIDSALAACWAERGSNLAPLRVAGLGQPLTD